MKSLVDGRIGRGGRAGRAFGIFEGTEQIQQLVVVRAISGLRIE